MTHLWVRGMYVFMLFDILVNFYKGDIGSVQSVRKKIHLLPVWVQDLESFKLS